MKNEAAEAGLVLEVRHVSGGYVEGGLFARQAGFHEVIHDVDFVVRHGEILGLVGESGTGKTTLTRMILGLLKPQSGEIIHYTKRPQIVFQDPYSSLNPAYTAEWAVEEPLRRESGGCTRCWSGWICLGTAGVRSRTSSPAGSASGCVSRWR